MFKGKIADQIGRDKKATFAFFQRAHHSISLVLIQSAWDEFGTESILLQSLRQHWAPELFNIY